MTVPTVALLLGRKGSKGLKDKNVLPLLGRPAYMYPLMAAVHSRHVTHTFVSTDHEQIISGCAEVGVENIERPPKLFTDGALFEDALEHAYFEAKRRIGQEPAYVVTLMCNAATVNSALIDAAVDMLEADPEADSAVSVSVFNMYSPLRARKLNAGGYLDPFVPFEAFGDPAKLSCDRGSQGDAYFADMSHSVSRGRCIENMSDGLLPQRWMGQRILPVVNGMGCDIDDPWQVDMTLRWLAEHGFDADNTPYDKM
jgi:CMP-N-acetylneuraminic acid synthetase